MLVEPVAGAGSLQDTMIPETLQPLRSTHPVGSPMNPHRTWLPHVETVFSLQWSRSPRWSNRPEPTLVTCPNTPLVN